MKRIKQLLKKCFRIFSCFVIPATAGIQRLWIPGQARNDASGGLLFLVRVEGESMWPALVPGRQYVASALARPRIGDYAVFRNPSDPSCVFVKRVAGIKNGFYRMESIVSWGSSSEDFGVVPRELILGKILL